VNIQEAIVKALEEQEPDLHGYRVIRIHDWEVGKFLSIPSINCRSVNVRRGEQSGYGLTYKEILADNWEVPVKIPEMD